MQNKILRRGFYIPLLSSLMGLMACPIPLSGLGHGPAKADKTAQSQPGQMLAKVGKTIITVEEFEKKLNRQSPFIRRRYKDLEKRREYLENQIRYELLAQEAQRRGYADDPEVRETLNKIMVQKLTRDEFGNQVKLEDISDADVADYFKAHPDDYNKAEMVRVSHIFFPYGDDKKAARAKGQKALQQLKNKKDDRLAFRNLAKELSADEASKNTGGDLRYNSKEQFTQKFDAKVAESIFALEKINDLSELVPGPKGFHIFKQTGRRQAITRTLDQVKTQIRNRLYRDRRAASFDNFISSLRSKSGVSIDEDKLAAVQITGLNEKAAGAAKAGPAKDVKAAKTVKDVKDVKAAKPSHQHQH